MHLRHLLSLSLCTPGLQRPSSMVAGAAPPGRKWGMDGGITADQGQRALPVVMNGNPQKARRVKISRGENRAEPEKSSIPKRWAQTINQEKVSRAIASGWGQGGILPNRHRAERGRRRRRKTGLGCRSANHDELESRQRDNKV